MLPGVGLDAACGLEVGLRGGRRVEQREVEARREVLRGAGERAEPGVGVMTSPARYLRRILPPASRYAVANRQGRWKLRNGDSVPWAKADRDRLAAFHAGTKLLRRRRCPFRTVRSRSWRCLGRRGLRCSPHLRWPPSGSHWVRGACVDWRSATRKTRRVAWRRRESRVLLRAPLVIARGDRPAHRRLTGSSLG